MRVRVQSRPPLYGKGSSSTVLKMATDANLLVWDILRQPQVDDDTDT